MRILHKIQCIVLCSIMLAVVSCGTKKKAVTNHTPETSIEVPAWHTCLIQGAKAVATTNRQKLSATVTMQTVHDSLIIISIMPALGIEMARLEATPKELVVFEKIHNIYALTTYAELNKKLTPSLSWKTLQQLCSAELPTGDKTARLAYTYGKEKLTLDLRYTPRKVNVPLKLTRLRTDKYTKTDIGKWL